MFWLIWNCPDSGTRTIRATTYVFVFGLRTKGLSAPKLGCFPSLGIRGRAFWIATRCRIPRARDGPPSALVHRCGNDWIRRDLAVRDGTRESRQSIPAAAVLLIQAEVRFWVNLRK